MWPFKKKAPSVVILSPSPPSAPVPFPSTSVPKSTVEPEKLRAYAAAAEAIGFVPAELVRDQLLAFFEEQNIKLYNNDQTRAWITDKSERAGTGLWNWCSLRKRDIITDYIWGCDEKTGRKQAGYYNSEFWECNPYDRLIPSSTLELVKRIEKRFEDQVKFFVTGYAAPNAGHLIMVRPAMCPPHMEPGYAFIFDAWGKDDA